MQDFRKYLSTAAVYAMRMTNKRICCKVWPWSLRSAWKPDSLLVLENSSVRIMEALKPSNILIMQGVLFWIPGFLDLNVTGHNDDLDYQ